MQHLGEKGLIKRAEEAIENSTEYGTTTPIKDEYDNIYSRRI